MNDKLAVRAGAVLAVVLAMLLLAVIVASVLVSVPVESQENGAGDGVQSGSGSTTRNGTTPPPNPGSSSGGKPAVPSKPKNQTRPGPGAPNPPLPSGEAASHVGKADLTTSVSGQTYTIEVAVSIKLDETGGFSFAYEGTGTVPVNLGADIAATADYVVKGSFDGTLNGESFSGNGPATIQATIKIPGTSPQSGNSTEQLTIEGSMHKVEGGRLEGDFTGGSYSGTFRADAV